MKTSVSHFIHSEESEPPLALARSSHGAWSFSDWSEFSPFVVSSSSDFLLLFTRSKVWQVHKPKMCYHRHFLSSVFNKVCPCLLCVLIIFDLSAWIGKQMSKYCLSSR